MDANEYLKKVTPAAHRSRLAPFWNDITQLRESNCTLDQVREYLAENGVVISIAGLSNYIKRRDEKTRQKADQPLRRSTDKKEVGAGPEAGTPAANPAGGEPPPSPQSPSDAVKPAKPPAPKKARGGNTRQESLSAEDLKKLFCGSPDLSAFEDDTD